MTIYRVKPLIVWAAVRRDRIKCCGLTQKAVKSHAEKRSGALSWAALKEDGWRLIKVKITPIN